LTRLRLLAQLRIDVGWTLAKDQARCQDKEDGNKKAFH
jgi:hypothetical protein